MDTLRTWRTASYSTSACEFAPTTAPKQQARQATIAGMSREHGVPTGQVMAHAVAMDDDERVWMVEPEDLDPA